MRELKVDLKQQEYEALIDTFMPSIDMRQHLKQIKLAPVKIMELMIAAPVCLDVKRDWFKKLAAIEQIVDDGHTEDIDIEIYRFEDVAKELDEALDELYEEGACQFTIESCWYDLDIKESKSYLLGVAESYEDAKSIIQHEIWEEEDVADDSESDERYPCWYEVKKWGKRKAHSKFEQYIHIILWVQKHQYCLMQSLKLLGKRVTLISPYLDLQIVKCLNCHFHISLEILLQ